MHIDLMIGGEKQTFSVPFVPMLAKRKYYEIQANAEERTEQPTVRELIQEDNEMLSILTDVVFKGQFTIEQLLSGASKQYIDRKLEEAIFGLTTKKKEQEEGNGKGK